MVWFIPLQKGRSSFYNILPLSAKTNLQVYRVVFIALLGTQNLAKDGRLREFDYEGIKKSRKFSCHLMNSASFLAASGCSFDFRHKGR